MADETRIFLVRHGQTEWNLQGRLQGHRDSPLTAAGRAQAHSTREALAEETIHIAYASPLKRAWETLSIIVAGRGIETIACDSLKEIRLGPWEGKTRAETERSDPLETVRFWSSQDQFELSGAETYRQLQDRVVDKLNDLSALHRGKNILVVSHWIAIKTAVAFFTGTPLGQLSAVPDLENGAFLTLSSRDGEISIR